MQDAKINSVDLVKCENRNIFFFYDIFFILERIKNKIFCYQYLPKVFISLEFCEINFVNSCYIWNQILKF